MKHLTSILTLIITLALLFTASCFAADIDFGWDANAEPDLAGYRLYQSTTSDIYVKGVDSPNFVAEIPAGTQTYTQQDVTDGTYYWVLTAFDVAGNESDYKGDDGSNEVTLTVDETGPAPPSGFWGFIKQVISWLRSQFGFHARVIG